MHTNGGNIQTFVEKKEEGNKELMLYQKGAIYPDDLPVIPLTLRFPYNGIWSRSWTKPEEFPLATSSTLNRFRTPKTLRELGKERNLYRLAIFPDYHTKEIPEYSGRSEFEVPQLPLAYPELAGFDEAPVGSTNSTQNSNSSDATRNIWGFLMTGLGFWTGLEQAKYQAQITEAQAKLLEAQAAQKASVTTASLVSNLPLLLLLGGVGFVLFSTLDKKGGK